MSIQTTHIPSILLIQSDLQRWNYLKSGDIRAQQCSALQLPVNNTMPYGQV